MQSGFLLEGQEIMDGPVAQDSALTLELGTDQDDSKMGFALGSGAGMAGMPLGLVDHLEMGRRQGLAQDFFDALSAVHELKMGVFRLHFNRQSLRLRAQPPIVT